MVLELVGVSLAICFAQAHHSQPLQALPRHALRVPTALILTGIVGLGVALVVETIDTSLGAAVTMSGFIVFGFMLCVLLSVCSLGGYVGGNVGGV
jgi:hypothetical protein